MIVPLITLVLRVQLSRPTAMLAFPGTLGLRLIVLAVIGLTAFSEHPAVAAQADSASSSVAQTAKATQEASSQETTSTSTPDSADKQEPKTQESEAPPKPEGEPTSKLPIMAFVGGELRTCDDSGTITSGTILVQGNKILAIGDGSLPIPDGAERIDLQGSIVTPGLIDAQSQLWLADGSADAGASDASLNVIDGIDPYADDWHDVLRQGITAVYLQPSRQGSLGGFGAVVSVAPGENEQPVVLAQTVALQASFGIGANNNRTRQQQLERTKKTLENAAEYAKKWKEYNDFVAKQSEGKKAETASGDKASSDKPNAPNSGDAPAKTTDARVGKPTPETPEKPAPEKTVAGKQDSGDKPDSEKGAAEKQAEKPPKKPDVDPVQERLVKVLEGEIPLRIEVNTSDDVAFLKQLLDDEKYQKIQVIFAGLNDLRSAIPSIKEANNPLILGPWLSVEPLRSADHDAAATWGSQFADYSGTVVIVSNGNRSRSSRLLRAHAAAAVSHGFSRERALRAITSDAARTLGVAEHIGSLAAGKRADFVSFAGEPTDSQTPVNLVVSHGVIAYRAPTIASVPPPASATQASLATIGELTKRFPRRYALRSRRVLIDGVLQSGTVVVDDGRFVQFAKESTAVEGEQPTFQLGDAVLTPGLCSTHANLGLSRLIDPQELPDSSFVVAADCLFELRQQQQLIDSGLLRVVLSPGSSNPVAGFSSLIRIGAAEPIATRQAAIKLVLSANGRNPNRFPSSLAGQLQFLRQSLAGALLDSRLFLPESVEQNLVQRRQAVWQSLVNGQQLAVIEAETDAEITAALNLIENNKLKGALTGMRQLSPFLERIKSLGVTLVVQPIGPENYQWFSDDLAQASHAGIPIVFAGENAEQLRLTATMSGLPPDVALRGLCDGPSSLWGAPTAFSAGAPADFVIWTDTPVNLAAIPLRVVVDGRHVGGRSPTDSSVKEKGK